MIDYIHDEGVEISEATRLLLLHRNESKQQSADMMKLFDRLCTIAFTVLRQGLPFTVEEKEHYFSSSGSKEPRSALESRRVSLGAHWVD